MESMEAAHQHFRFAHLACPDRKAIELCESQQHPPIESPQRAEMHRQCGPMAPIALLATRAAFAEIKRATLLHSVRSIEAPGAAPAHRGSGVGDTDVAWDPARCARSVAGRRARTRTAWPLRRWRRLLAPYARTTRRDSSPGRNAQVAGVEEEMPKRAPHDRCRSCAERGAAKPHRHGSTGRACLESASGSCVHSSPLPPPGQGRVSADERCDRFRQHRRRAARSPRSGVRPSLQGSMTDGIRARGLSRWRAVSKPG